MEKVTPIFTMFFFVLELNGRTKEPNRVKAGPDLDEGNARPVGITNGKLGARGLELGSEETEKDQGTVEE